MYFIGLILKYYYMNNKKFFIWSFSFLFATITLFFFNNVIGMHFVKESIPLTLLVTSITYLIVGLIIRKKLVQVQSLKRILFTLIVCSIISAILLIFLEKGILLTLSFLIIWFIGGILLFSWSKPQQVV